MFQKYADRSVGRPKLLPTFDNIIQEKAEIIKYLSSHLVTKKIIYKQELLDLIDDYYIKNSR